MEKIVVTGGAGYIGSHIVDELVKKGSVTAIDNFSSGKLENLEENIGKIALEKMDLRNEALVTEVFSEKKPKTVFHFAAEKHVKLQEPKAFLENNVFATHNVLEACRKASVQKIVFASTSAVYGNAKKLPTPESYSTGNPISLYAASKVACEAMISAYCNNYGMAGVAVRFSNVVGGRQNGGVTFDFFNKLKKDSKRLEIIGDGTQTKNYLYISDCVAGTIAASKHAKKGCLEAYNIASKGTTTVNEVADAVASAMKLKNVKKSYTGSTWKGDVVKMELDASKLEKTGWKCKYNSNQAVAQEAKELTRTQ